MKTHRYLSGVLLAAGLALPVAASDVTYESLPVLKAPSQKTPGVTNLLVERSHQTILGLTLLQNTFADVTRRFGTSSSVPIAGFTHGKGVCVSAAQNDDPTKLLFVTIPVANLHGFILLSKESAFKVPTNCVPSAEVHKNMRTESGIHLGMKRADIAKALGKPFRQTESSLHFRFEIQKKFFPKQWFEEYRMQNKGVDPQSLYTDVRTDVKVEFVNDRLVSYSVSTTDTF